MIRTDSNHEITHQVTEAAAKNPNGWVYKIEGAFNPDQDVPPEAIVGAWKVDSNGNIVGDFIPNPKYQPKTKHSSQSLGDSFI